MIELTGVAKVYGGLLSGVLGDGRVLALSGIDARIDRGSAVGIVGLNGAGKSTLLRILLGFLRPTEGVARIGGMDPRRYVERFGIAYVPERIAIPRRWTVRGALRTYAMLGKPGEDAWSRVDEVLERLGLSPLAGRRVGTLSRGNLQRLGIAQALLGDRSIMVLDEPTDALDPVCIVELRSIVAEWRSAREDRIVVLASHDLSEVERIVDRVLLIHNGRIRDEVELGTVGGTLESWFLKRIGELEEARN